MALTSGTKLGPYEIRAPLGAGGMGEVYRARDTRLEREIAIKILPAKFSSDPSLRERLQREARAVSKLSHPHICTLHDIGHQDGIDFLVMELIEGETLEQRLARGPIPIEQAMRYAAEIADALAKAHRLGISHRDLKPANIMLSKSGAKLMDFGLAKQSTGAALPDISAEMTAEHSKLTSEGTLVGTFQYMAPEQLEGHEADSRADIFALGEVIYEMLTGKPAFSGKSRASLIASILSADPPAIAQVRPLTPPRLEWLLKKCLAKDPNERWQSAADLADELNWLAGERETGPTAAIVKHRLRTERAIWIVAAIALAAIVGVATYFQFRPTPRFAHRARWMISPPENALFQATGDFGGPVVVSPDGRNLAFVAADKSGKAQLWVRGIDALKAVALPNTEGAAWPFWSPDSRSLGFFARGRLKRIAIESGSSINLCEVKIARGGSWGADGTIVFSPHTNSELYRVAASGGPVSAVTHVDLSQHDSHRWPFFLPDGKHFLYFAAGHLDISHSRDGLYVGSLDGKDTKFLVHTHTNGAYANGHLLFLNENVLMAQKFDLRKLEVTGEPRVVQEGIEQHPTWWLAVFSVSQNGMLAFTPNQNIGNELVWLDRNQKRAETVGEPGSYATVRLSPDDQMLAVEYERPDHQIWIHDLKHKTATQFTFGPSASALPVWSPDSKQIVFASQQAGHHDLHIKNLGGTQAEEVLLSTQFFNYPLDWSSDGSFLLYLSSDPGNIHPQLWALPMHGARKPRLLLEAPIYDADGRFSPDIHWIAYESREQGPQKIFVMPFPETGARSPISPAGSASPVWRKDGGAILYADDTGAMVNETEVHRSGSEIAAGTTRRSEMGAAAPVFAGPPFDITRDGRIVYISRGAENKAEVVVVANWDDTQQR